MTTEINEYEKQATDFLSSANATISFNYKSFDRYFPTDSQARNIFEWVIEREGKQIKGMFGASIVDSCKPTPKLSTNEPIEFYCGLRYNISAPHVTPKYIYFGIPIKTTCDVLAKVLYGSVEVQALYDFGIIQDKYNAFAAEYKKKVSPRLTGYMSTLEACEGYVISRIKAKIKELETETTLYSQDGNIKQPTAYDLLSCITKCDPGTFENFCADYGYDNDSLKDEKIYKTVLKEWKQVESIFTTEQIEQLQEIQ